VLCTIFLTFYLNVKNILHNIVSPQNTTMDVNNVMLDSRFIFICFVAFFVEECKKDLLHVRFTHRECHVHKYNMTFVTVTRVFGTVSQMMHIVLCFIHSQSFMGDTKSPPANYGGCQIRAGATLPQNFGQRPGFF
jgi:hypothetical protein